MKLNKKIKALPWTAEFDTVINEDFAVAVAQPVVDHERLLVVTFTVNQGKKTYTERRDFRLVCFKKQNRARVIFRGWTGAKKQNLTTAMSGAGMRTQPAYCYPRITERDEAALATWLGIKDTKKTKNHHLPELEAWVDKAIAAEDKAAAEVAGVIEDEAVDLLCPDELPAGLIDWVRREVLTEDHTLVYKKGGVRGLCYRCREKVRADRAQHFRQGEATTCPKTEAEENEIVLKEIKQTKETLELTPADRTDIITECENRIAVYEEFAPKMLDEEAIKAVIGEVLGNLGIETPTAKDKGKIMGQLMPKVKGVADGKLVNQILASMMR